MIFSKEEVNTSRQFEFDMAKFITIFIMVAIHCFEELSIGSIADEMNPVYYFFTIILNNLHGAGIFMASMGLGIAYSWKGDADKQIQRGLRLFILAYVLNFLREGIPAIICSVFDVEYYSFLTAFLCDDILEFAGLALILFGFIKKKGLSDRALAIIAVAMSITGSFFRFIDVGPSNLNQIAGLLIGTVDDVDSQCYAAFPLFNWFIIVVFGYLLGKLVRRCRNMEKFYAVTFPVSAVLLTAYLVMTVPNRTGFMCEDLLYFYQMDTFGACIQIVGLLTFTGLYHYISKLFGARAKRFITGLSSNINSVYCIQWVIIGWSLCFIFLTGSDPLDNEATLVTAVAVYMVSNLLAWQYNKWKKRKMLQ